VSDAGTRLEHWLTQLEHKQVSLGDVVNYIKGFSFTPHPSKGAYQLMHEDINGDPHVPDDASFYPISRAYTLGRITRHEYEMLAHAAAGTSPESEAGEPGQ
jgi:hypothetical protein